MTNGPGKAFLADPRPATITKGDRSFVNRSNASINYRFLSAGLSGQRFEALVGEMGPASLNDSHAHEGEEFGYVLEGRIRLTTEDEAHELGLDDSYHLMASTPHACEAGPDGAKVLWIRTTPRLAGLGLLERGEHAAERSTEHSTRGGIVAEGGDAPPVNLSDNAVRYRFLSGALPEARLQVVVAEIPSAYKPGPKSFEGEEFGYVLDGRLHLAVAEDSYVLGTGDCYHLPASSELAYRTDDEMGAKVLWAQMSGGHPELEDALSSAIGEEAPFGKRSR